MSLFRMVVFAYTSSKKDITVYFRLIVTWISSTCAQKEEESWFKPSILGNANDGYAFWTILFRCCCEYIQISATWMNNSNRLCSKQLHFARTRYQDRPHRARKHGRFRDSKVLNWSNYCSKYQATGCGVKDSALLHLLGDLIQFDKDVFNWV